MFCRGVQLHKLLSSGHHPLKKKAGWIYSVTTTIRLILKELTKLLKDQFLPEIALGELAAAKVSIVFDCQFVNREVVWPDDIITIIYKVQQVLNGFP